MGNISGGLLVAKTLKNEGVEQIFGLVGYYVASIFESCQCENIRVCDTRHEQGAVLMADGYAQLTGKPGVVVVIGGCGFSNTVSGIIKAYKSFTPMIVLVGVLPHARKDTNALQDMDNLSVVRQYTKWCGTVFDIARIPEYIAIAMRHATCGRRGPVVLEIPVNCVMNEVDEEKVVWPVNCRTNAKMYGDYSKIKESIEILKASKKPILIAGNGVFYSNGSQALKEFVEYVGIPTYSVNAGRGTLPDNHELCFGCGRTVEAGPNMYSYRNADTVIVMGSSLDYTISFGKPPVFCNNQKFIQVDIDPEEIGSSSRGIDVGIVGHSDTVLKQFLDEMKKEGISLKSQFEPWVKELKNWHEQYWRELYSDVQTEQLPIHPVALLKAICDNLSHNTIYVIDGSNAMMWGSLMLKGYSPGSIVIGPSGTFGPMGTGLPLALGAKVANPDKTVVLYTGDGSFGFNAIEINTAIRLGLQVIVIIHNDNAWGFCKDTQRTLFGEDKCNAGMDLGFTRYDRMVEAFGGHGELVESYDEIIPALERALNSKKVSCINVVIDENAISPGARTFNQNIRKQWGFKDSRGIWRSW